MGGEEYRQIGGGENPTNCGELLRAPLEDRDLLDLEDGRVAQPNPMAGGHPPSCPRSPLGS